ncbi:MAG: DNA-directed RNA polymerase subunit beta', partial [bacterium]|nr:DNA-directed RNA polymerase subunit beta' [bacterium]
MPALFEEKSFDFDAVRLKLASPDVIRTWSHGEVTKPETINYRTQKPEREGLFDERIFGPVKDWECYCGKYRRIRYKGIVCDKCGVEVTRSIVRRERMGHIELASPVSHIWFLRGVPSKIGLLLDLNVQQLEKVVYFASYVVTDVNRAALDDAASRLEAESKQKEEKVRKLFQETIDRLRQEHAQKLQITVSTEERAAIEQALRKLLEEREREKEKELSSLTQAVGKARAELTLLQPLQIISEVEYRSLSLKYGGVFTAGIGAEVLRKICEGLDLVKLAKELEGDLGTAPAAKRKRVVRRLALVRSLLKAKIRPEWMFLTAIPVIPPDLRPMVQLEGGRFAASDLNDLYRRVINRNNRLRRLLGMGAPEVIVRNEKRMLQEAVDALIDNQARRGSTTTALTGQRRQLKSLADILKGKQGRFRQNLLGKRVDYSGRSVIVVGPHLRLHQCGIPKRMALELFKPFVIHVLIERGLAHNIRSAARLIEQGIPEVWDALERVTREHKVLLNRAPTLHRLGIQAFQPVLIEGKAIQVHPAVCPPFNADFDGDQMAVHIPLSLEARREADEIMVSVRNLLKPSSGEPVTSPHQDVVLGCYYLTRVKESALGEGRVFGDANEAILAYDTGYLAVNAAIKVRLAVAGSGDQSSGTGSLTETTVGRILFNEVLPRGMSFVNDLLDKKKLQAILADVLARYGLEEAATLIDQLKDLGFSAATQSGHSWGMDDLTVPAHKQQLVAEAEKKVATIRAQFDEGLLTEEERYVKTIEVWEGVKSAIADSVKETLNPEGSVHAMIASGARGSWGQVTQMMGMKGLVISPTGRTHELPIKSSFKEGFDVLEYFVSTHGTRKGMADTALRTSTAGYLTRRLVNVASDIVVHEQDCGDTRGWTLALDESADMGTTLARRLQGRILAADILDSAGTVLASAGEVVSKELAQVTEKANVPSARIRSVLTCRTLRGVCQRCYGWDLGSNFLVNIGEAVGIIAAQSIGEPGTQLTMRTVHMGGVAGGVDITQGLPRVEELFEARPPKGAALISEIAGSVRLETAEDESALVTVQSSGPGRDAYRRAGIILAEGVSDGARVEAGQRLFMDLEGE